MSIDSQCKEWLEGQDAGLAVVVIQDGKVIHKQGYGFANVADELEPDADTVFDLASCSKHFTATAIMMLAERGKLDYDDPLTKFFPDFPDYAQDITVKHLLHHTGGLKDYFELYEADGDDLERWGEGDRPTSADIVAALAQEPKPAFKAGAKFDYSNSGYVVLGQIASKAAGKPMPKFLHDEAFKKLGMARTFVYDGTQAADDNAAQGYEDGEPFDVTPLDDAYGDGGVHTTLNDLVRWNAAMDADTLVSKATRELARESGTLNNGEETGYGFGWFVGEEDDEPWVNHEGSYGGFRTYITKEAGLAVIVLSNFAEAEPDKLGDAIAESLSGAEDEDADEDGDADDDEDEE